MKFDKIFALYVFMIYVVSRDVLTATSCPRTCLTDDQVMSCNNVKEKALPFILACADGTQDIVVVDLRYSRMGCSCVYLDFTSQLLDINIIVYDVVACSSYSIEICLNSSSPTPSMAPGSDQSPNVYHHMFGAVFNVQSADWRSRFNHHYYRLWSALSTLKDASVRTFYITTMMVRSRSALRWMETHAAKASGDLAENRSLANADGETRLALNASLTTPTSPTETDRMTKIVIFSSIIGVVVLVIVVFLLCKLERERRHMETNTKHGDLCLDSSIQTRLCNWQNFLEKLANYRRQKAELVARNADSHHRTAKQMFVEQSTIDSTGGILTREHGPAAAVSSLTRLVALQPLESASQLSYDTTASSSRNRSRTSIGSQRFEPLGVSSRETNASDIVPPLES